MNTLRLTMAILRKDLRIELRSGEVTITTLLFALILTVMVSVALYDSQVATKMAPGVLWIVIAFSGVLVMGRLWARERESEMFRALLLSPIPPTALFLGKAAGALLFLALVEAILVPLVAVLFGVDLMSYVPPGRIEGRFILPELLLLLSLGTVGFIAIGTLFGAMTVQTSVRDFVFSLVLFPLMTPALLSGAQATEELMLGATWTELSGWVYLLGAFALASVGSGLLLFDSLTRD